MPPSRPASGAQITAADVAALYAGANFYSPSVGDTTRVTLIDWLTGLLGETGPLPLLKPESMPATSWCAALCILGSGAALADLPPAGDEFVTAVRTLERTIDRPLAAVYPLAAATVSALFPVIAAAQLGLPLLDCDGMGRAFAQINQTTMFLAGLSVSPAVLTGAAGETFTLTSPNSERADVLSRSALDVLGGWAAFAAYPASIGDTARGASRGNVSRLLEVGRLLLEPMSTDLLVNRLSAVNATRRIARGRIVDLEHLTRPADLSVPTHPTSAVLDEVGGAILRLELRSEIVAAFVDGVLTAAAPDLISLFDVRSGRMAALDSLENGDLLDVLVTPADAVWYSPEGLALVGPSVHHIPLDHPRRR
ncbi:DUF917 domain-containing protein [Nakamurella sp. A5-74]|uniref:DUF917 domain-containing protein n=1 Tax=Nakamurella sp. A5-74 TaxID=3158264 RepID=A0AAU8DPY3_9ACTN